MKETHRQNVRILIEAIDRKSAAAISLDDIYKFRQELLNLKHSGPQLQQMLDTTASVMNKEFLWQRKDEKINLKNSL